MQRHFISIVLVSIALTLQSCYYTGNTYTFLNPEEAIRNVNSREHNLGYHMQPYQLDAPLLTSEGQRYLRFGLSNGLCFSGAVALDSRWRWHGGISYGYFKKKFEENAPVKLHVEHFTDGMLDDEYDIRTSATLDDVVKHKQLLLESSIGYRLSPGKKAIQEIYGGLGIGNNSTVHELNLHYEDANQPYDMKEARSEIQGFIQYNIGASGKVAEINTMHRVAFENNYGQKILANPLSIQSDMSPISFFYTGGLRLATGKKKVRMFFQYEWIVPFNNADIIWKNGQFSAGITIRGNKKSPK